MRADGQGVESEVLIDDWIDVGVFGEREVDGERQETVLLLEKRRITGPEVTFELVVDERPVRVGIDPYNKLVDRNSDDNVKKVKETALAELGSELGGWLRGLRGPGSPRSTALPARRGLPRAAGCSRSPGRSRGCRRPG